MNLYDMAEEPALSAEELIDSAAELLDRGDAA